MKFNRPNKFLFVLFLSVFCQVSLFAQAAQQQTELATYIKENYTNR